MGRNAKNAGIKRLTDGTTVFADPGSKAHTEIQTRAVQIFCREINGGARVNEALYTALQYVSIGLNHKLDKALAAACVNTNFKKPPCILRDSPIRVQHQHPITYR